MTQERAPILVTDLDGDDRFVTSLSMKISGMQSAMVAPLISPNDSRVFGVLYVDNLSRTLAFSQEELNVLAVVATQAAAAIDGLFAHERLAPKRFSGRRWVDSSRQKWCRWSKRIPTA